MYQGKQACSFFAKGHCNKGADCAFLHVTAAEAEEESPPGAQRARGQYTGAPGPSISEMD